MASISKKADELKIDPVMEKPWQRAQRFEKYDYYSKSAYPPINLEPLAYERSRLANGGMTPEQRGLRSQFLKDQVLHHEAREIPQVQPYNIFRRIYRWPADTFIFSPAKKFIGADRADLLRYTIPKVVMAILGSYLIWYQLKYHPSNWTNSGRVRIFSTKPILLGEETKNVPNKDPSEFNDRGFKTRTVLLNQD